MATQSVTLQLPALLYQKLEMRAEQTHRSVEAELLEVLTTAVTVDDELSPDLAEALTPLAVLDDEDLWRAAQSRLSAEDTERLESLHLKRQREGLTKVEAEDAASLVRRYERAILVRAEAAALLKQRGHDISALLAAA